MKLTNDSNHLMSFFIENNCLLPLKLTKKTETILEKLYNEIKNGVSYISELKSKNGNSFYKLKVVETITNINQIPKPETFSPNSFPPEIRKHIDENSMGTLKYSFNLFGRNIEIIFILEMLDDPMWIEKYNKYVDYMLVWLYIVDINSSRDCVNHLKIYIYHTSLLKMIPNTNIEILNENHVNTAFTTTCPSNSEIVVFRKEEWFKVFMHETFHNFGLDFSDMNLLSCNEKILDIFPVNSDVNLYESYTECWARIMNCLFCSFINMKNKNDVNDFLSNAQFFIGIERIFAFFQIVKILNFMGLTYKDLYGKSVISDNLRKTLYREDTNVLSYYVITLILLNNYQDFVLWCNTNNISLLQFKKTNKNLDKYCSFIEKKYKTKSLLEGIECTEELYIKILKSHKKNKKMLLLLKNLRMTICELG